MKRKVHLRRKEQGHRVGYGFLPILCWGSGAFREGHRQLLPLRPCYQRRVSPFSSCITIGAVNGESKINYVFRNDWTFAIHDSCPVRARLVIKLEMQDFTDDLLYCQIHRSCSSNATARPIFSPVLSDSLASHLFHHHIHKVVLLDSLPCSESSTILSFSTLANLSNLSLSQSS